MIYFTSDFHFLHDRPFIYEPRGFKSVGEMDEMLLAKYNAIVRPEDDVYILGDVMLGGADRMADGIAYCNRLQGRIHLVRGNHDTNKRWAAYLTECKWNLVELGDAIYFNYGKYHFYLSHYPTITSNNDYDKPLKQRLLNICGHSHTQDKWCDYDKGYIYHCELDAHNCYPVSIDTILQDFKDKYENNKRSTNIHFGARRLSYMLTNCSKCVYEYGSCPGPTYRPTQCPDGFIYKRDPPDGGYYG